MARGDARLKLLDAAVRVIRTKGYESTTVDDLCASAGVTKGAFFHHFASKDELGVEAARRWTEVTAPLFASAPYHQPVDAADRVLAYVLFRRALLDGPVPDVTCLAGTMAQEVYDTHPRIRDACSASICGHAATLVDDIQAAMTAERVVGFTAESLALYTQAVLQGAFVLAKATGGTAVAFDCVDHLYRHLATLFHRPPEPPLFQPKELV
jgi:TetR/AcrR family transcriptional repressor of nem operon